MRSPSQQKFIQYLQSDLKVSEKAVDLALRLQKPLQGPLHILLWQHGLIDIEQLGKAFEWLMTEREINHHKKSVVSKNLNRSKDVRQLGGKE